MKRFLRITLLILVSTLYGGGYALADDETFDFVKMFSDGVSDWSTTYAKHEVSGTICTVTFAKASKQTSSIKDCPVTKGSNITVALNDLTSYDITSVSLTLKQWGSKTQTVTLSTSTDGSTFTKTSTSSSNFSLSAEGLSAKALQFSFSSASNQVGVQSITIGYKPTGDTRTATALSFGTLKTKTLAVNETFTAPTPALTAGEEALTGKTIKYSSSYTSVATVDESTGVVTAVANGTAIITASYEGDDTYKPASNSYIVIVSEGRYTIAEMKKKITAKSSAAAESFTLNLTDAVVTYASDKNAYLQDASGAIFLYLTNNPLTAGQKINGIVNVTAFLYNGLAEIVSLNTDEATITADATIPDAELVTLEELNSNYAAYESKRVKVEYATVASVFSSQKATISQDDGTIFTVRDAGNNSLTLTKGNLVTIEGFPAVYNSAYQLSVWSQDDISEIGEDTRETPTLSFPAEAYSVDVSETFTAPTLTAPEGVKVKYASSNTAAATVDATTGVVTVVAYGTTTITATSIGNSTYKSGSASYTLTVTDPSVAEASFDFSKPADYGFTEPTEDNNITVNEGETIVSGIVTITNVTNSSANTNKFFYSNGAIDLRIYKDSKISISVPKGYVITGISADVDLNTSLTWDSGTVTNKVWKGSANSVTVIPSKVVKFSTMTVTYKEAFDVTLDDTQKYTQTEAEGQSVKLNRSFKKGGLGTICLPFDLSADQITAAFGEGTTLYEYTSVTGSTMNFTPVTETTASMPYLVKTAEDKDCLVFESVDISECSPQELMYQNEEGDVYAMQGTFGPIEMTTDGSQLFLTASGELKKPTSTDNKANVIKGFRAFFETTATGSEAKIGFGNMETSVQNIQLFDAATKVYSLNGQLVGSSLKGLSKGVYVVNGKKYIVK